MTVLIVVLLITVIAGATAYVLDERQRQSERARQRRERLRIEHEQFLAEIRLHRMTQTALQHLLDEARSSKDPIRGGGNRR